MYAYTYIIHHNIFKASFEQNLIFSNGRGVEGTLVGSFQTHFPIDYVTPLCPPAHEPICYTPLSPPALGAIMGKTQSTM